MNRGWSLTASARASGEADLVGRRPRFDIQIVQHLDVIGEEADRHQDRRLEAVRARLAQVVVHVGLEPRILGPAAAALVDEGPVVGALQRATAVAESVQLLARSDRRRTCRSGSSAR